MQAIFTMHSFDVTVAQNGYEAYQKVINSIQMTNKSDENMNDPLWRSGISKVTEKRNECLFDLIVLDLNMPISDGFDTCKNIL